MCVCVCVSVCTCVDVCVGEEGEEGGRGVGGSRGGGHEGGRRAWGKGKDQPKILCRVMDGYEQVVSTLQRVINHYQRLRMLIVRNFL